MTRNKIYSVMKACRAALLGVFIAVPLVGEETENFRAAESISYTEIRLAKKFYGFNELIDSTPSADGPIYKKYKRLTLSGNVKESNTGDFKGTQRTDFTGAAVFTGSTMANGLLRREFRTIGPGGEGDGSGGPFAYAGDGSGACWPTAFYNLLNEVPVTPGSGLLPETFATTTVSPTRRETTGTMQLLWSKIHLPCNLFTFQTGSDTWQSTGPIVEQLSEPADGEIVTDTRLDGYFTNAVASLTYRMETGGWSALSTVPGILEDISYEAAARFRVSPEKCQLGGAGVMHVTFDKWQGSGTHQTEVRKFAVSLDRSALGISEVEGKFTFRASKVGESIKVVSAVLEIDDGGCASCNTDEGNTSNGLGSIRWSMNLGKTNSGQLAGVLQVRSETWGTALYSPVGLSFIGPGIVNDSSAVVRRGDDTLRQIRTGRYLVDILTTAEVPSIPSNGYEIRFYSQAGSVPSASNPELHDASSAPLYVTKFSDPDGQGNKLAIKRYGASASNAISEVQYSYNSSTNTWSLEEGGLRRTDKTITSLSSTEDECLTSVWDIRPSGAVKVYEVKDRKRKYVVGGVTFDVVYERTIDPSGAALKKTWTYYVYNGFLRVDQFSDYNGDWKRYSYFVSNSNNVTTRIYYSFSPFVNSGPTSPSSQQRNFAEGEQPDLDYDGDGRRDTFGDQYVLIGDTLTGVRSKRFTKTVLFDGQQCYVTEKGKIVGPNINWSDPAIKWELEYTYASGRFAGKTAYKKYSDQTLETVTYAFNATNAQVTEVRSRGAGDALMQAVVDGFRTTTVTDVAGRFLSMTKRDIASNLVVESQTVLQQDAYGRPTEIVMENGTTETRTYSPCCGHLTSSTRNGSTVTYAYDALGRRISESANGVTTVFAYDAMNRVVKTTRRGSDNSEVVMESKTFDLVGRLTSKADALARTTTIGEVYNSDRTTTRTTTFPDQSTLVEVINADGSAASRAGTRAVPTYWQHAVSAAGTVPCVATTEFKGASGTSPTEWVKTFVDGWGRQLRTEFPDGAAATQGYDMAYRLTARSDPDGVVTLFNYNLKGEQDLTAIDMNGNAVIDASGTDRISKVVSTVATKAEDSVSYTVLRSTTQVWETDNQDAATTVAISERSVDGLRAWETVRGLTTKRVTVLNGVGGRTVTTTAPDGLKTIQVYSADRLTSATVKTQADVQISAVTYAYDAHGRLSSSTDARNGTTSYTYFADDQIQTTTSPDPHPTQSGSGYDPQTTTFAYDSAGRVQSVTHPDGGVVTTTYWPTSAVKRTSGARTYPVEYTYDSQQRIKTLTTWQNFAGDSGKAVTTWNYDASRGWLVNKRYADNTGPAYTYKPSGRLLTREWARTPVITTTYSYNAAGDLSGTDYSDTTPDVVLTYDRSGRAKNLTDGVGTRSLGYHASGQLEDETYTSGVLNGYVLDRSFDSLHRLSGFSALNPQALAINAISYSYDAASRLDTVTSGSNTATYLYATNSPLVDSVTFKNSGATRLTTTKIYDKLNRLASIGNQPSVAGAAALYYAYTYNAANQRTRTTREDSAYWNHGYDALGQVTSSQKFLANNTPLNGHDYAWTFDDIGNRKTSVVNGSSATYASNSLNQYQQRTVPGSIDVLGAANSSAIVTVSMNNGTPQATTRQGELFHKQIAVTNSSSAQNASLKVIGVKNLAGPNGEDVVSEITRSAFVAQTPESFSHDADGNLTADAKWTYTWDGENRLIAQETTAAASTAGVPHQKLEFLYDGQSRRVSKKVSSWNGSVWILSNHTFFLYDGWNLLAELNALSANAPLRTYAWGLDVSGSSQGAGGVGGLLSVTDSSTGTTHFFGYDGNGNVAGLIKAVDGTMTAKYDYTAFGETLTVEGVFGAANPFRFSTKYIDAESGNLYYGYRYYVPEIGRWLSRDPLSEAGGENLYGYIGNDAISAFDPMGLEKYSFSLKLGFGLVMGVKLDAEVKKEKCCTILTGSVSGGVGFGASYTGNNIGLSGNVVEGGQGQSFTFKFCDGDIMPSMFMNKVRLLSIGQSFSVGGHAGYKDIAFVGSEAGIKAEAYIDMTQTVTHYGMNISIILDGMAERVAGFYIKAGSYKLGKPYAPVPFDPFGGRSMFKKQEIFNVTLRYN